MNPTATNPILQRAASSDMTIVELIESAGALREGNAPEMICELYKIWIAHNVEHPSLHAIYFNYAVSLADIADHVGAINAFRAAIRLKTDFCPPYINLASQLERVGRIDSAAAAWNSMLALFPAVTGDTVANKLTALKQLGRLLETAHVPAVAESALMQSLELVPEQPDVIQHWIALRQGQCKWPIAPAEGRVPRERLLRAISPLSAACYTDDPMFQLANAWAYNCRAVPLPANPRRAFDGLPPPDEPAHRRMRVGYVSSDLRHHAVGFAMTDIFETHDRDNVEVFAYYCGIRAEDETQRRIRRAAEHWTDITTMDDLQAARQIRHDGVDILVDLNGYTKDARTKVFAFRPARVAVNWFGFPNTMGSPYHHYIIADATVIPVGHERFFSETVVRVPCYQANDRRRVISSDVPTRQELGLPEHDLVFCCLNGMQKISQLTFERWMLILKHVPDSALWLLAGTAETQERLRATAERHGVAGKRLIFADKRANPDHLARFQLADLFLDSFPYGAHTTASDSLWMGVPVITLRGRSFASRVCSSVVRAAGLSEMICDTPDDYVRLAITLGSDRERLAAVRKRLRDGRATCELFDTPLLVRNIEAAYQAMLDTAKCGQLPKPDLTNLEIYHKLGASEDLERMEQLTDDDYCALYRDRLADIDAVAPIPSDARLWQPDN